MEGASYRTIRTGGTFEVTEKKSRFIGESAHAENEEEALAFLEKIRKKHYDAKHHCFAFIGRDGTLVRSSDDGEPQGTAGHPILGVLQGAGLCACVLVVTRYFGGTLLGTGGLVRCYTAAAKGAVEASGVVEKKKGTLCDLRASYTDSGRLTYLLAENQIPVLDTSYGADVAWRIIIPDGRESALAKKIAEATAGRAAPENGRHVWYFEEDGSFLFEPEK
jgi:uncharacterized YigZ family protein